MSRCIICGVGLEKPFLELCEKCFTEHEQWCQMCGVTISFDEYLEAQSFYCKHCNFLLKSLADIPSTD